MFDEFTFRWFLIFSFSRQVCKRRVQNSRFPGFMRFATQCVAVFMAAYPHQFINYFDLLKLEATGI